MADRVFAAGTGATSHPPRSPAKSHRATTPRGRSPHVDLNLHPCDSRKSDCPFKGLGIRAPRCGRSGQARGCLKWMTAT